MGITCPNLVFNASFHMSYSLLDWVEIWQIFIPRRLELLKTHHCVHLIGIGNTFNWYSKIWRGERRLPLPSSSDATDLIKALWHIESWDFPKRRKKKRKKYASKRPTMHEYQMLFGSEILACHDKLCAQWVKFFCGVPMQPYK